MIISAHAYHLDELGVAINKLDDGWLAEECYDFVEYGTSATGGLLMHYFRSPTLMCKIYVEGRNYDPTYYYFFLGNPEKVARLFEEQLAVLQVVNG